MARIEMPWHELVKLLKPDGPGHHKVCVRSWLVRRNDNADRPWTDANDPNHRRKVCFTLEGPS